MRKYWKSDFLSTARHKVAEHYYRMKRQLGNREFFHHILFKHPVDEAYVCFLSHKHKWAYNAHFNTAQAALYESASEIVLKEACKLYDELGIDTELHFLPTTDTYDGKRLYTLDDSNFKTTHPQLGNMTTFDYETAKTHEYLTTNKPDVFESYTVRYDYSPVIPYLSMTVDAEVITDDVILEHINRFREMGEKDWKPPVPVDKSKLNYSYERPSFA